MVVKKDSILEQTNYSLLNYIHSFQVTLV